VGGTGEGTVVAVSVGARFVGVGNVDVNVPRQARIASNKIFTNKVIGKLSENFFIRG
jgi:hypothetical protein